MPRHPVCNFSVARSRPRTRRHHYWIGAALGALALASPLAIAAAPAVAQGIQFNSVGGDGSGDLTVTVTSDYPLTDWTLSLSNANGTYPLDDFADFTDTSAPFTAGAQQVYVLDAGAAEQDLESTLALPPGDYQVTATAATATDGVNVETLPSSQTLTGSFDFLAQPTLALSSSTFNTTKPNQSVTINGQITGCTTLACPSSWSNTSVTITNVTAVNKPRWVGATTDARGDFAVPGVTGVPGDEYSASAGPTATTLLATAPSDTQDVPQYAQTLIMATAAIAPYGKQTIKGTLTSQSGLQQAAAPAGVTITATPPPASHVPSVITTTNSSGAFSLTVPKITGTTNWSLSTAKDLASSPFLAATNSAPLPWPTAITKFTANVAPDGLLTVSGCMVIATSLPPSPSSTPIWLQWKKSRTSAWKTFGSVGTSKAPGCDGLYFTGQGSPPALSAYYRADVLPGVLASATYAGSTSASTGRVWSYPTRFQEFRASPRSVKAGHKVTISGILQYQSGSKWRAYAHEPIIILFAPTRKAQTWFEPYGGSVRTNRKGVFSWTFTDTSTEYWKAYYAGNDRHFAVTARPIPVRVHGGGSSDHAPPGQPVILPSATLSARGGTWPFVLSADPWLALMGD